MTVAALLPRPSKATRGVRISSTFSVLRPTDFTVYFSTNKRSRFARRSKYRGRSRAVEVKIRSNWLVFFNFSNSRLVESDVINGGVGMDTGSDHTDKLKFESFSGNNRKVRHIYVFRHSFPDVAYVQRLPNSLPYAKIWPKKFSPQISGKLTFFVKKKQKSSKKLVAIRSEIEILLKNSNFSTEVRLFVTPCLCRRVQC